MPVTAITKDLDNRTLTITADFAAPVERIWKLYADPRQLEQVWGCDLSGYDVDGPLPDIDPDPDGGIVQGRVALHDRLAGEDIEQLRPHVAAESLRLHRRENGGYVEQFGHAREQRARAPFAHYPRGVANGTWGPTHPMTGIIFRQGRKRTGKHMRQDASALTRGYP